MNTKKSKSRDWLVAKPFAHRGLHRADKGVIENSLSAFRRAIKNGFGIEMDVRLSADGEAMVFHDQELSRLTGRPGRVGSLTARDLNDFQLIGSKDKIETLGACLTVIRGQVPVLIEIKDEGEGNERLCIAVRRALEGYGGPVGVMSFNPIIPAWFAKTSPKICRGLVTSNVAPRYGLLGGTTMGHRLNARAAKAEFIAHDLRNLPNGFVEQQREKGIPCLSWTIRTEEDDSHAREYVDNIIFELTPPELRAAENEETAE